MLIYISLHMLQLSAPEEVDYSAKLIAYMLKTDYCEVMMEINTNNIQQFVIDHESLEIRVEHLNS